MEKYTTWCSSFPMWDWYDSMNTLTPSFQQLARGRLVTAYGEAKSHSETTETSKKKGRLISPNFCSESFFLVPCVGQLQLRFPCCKGGYHSGRFRRTLGSASVLFSAFSIIWTWLMNKLSVICILLSFCFIQSSMPCVFKTTSSNYQISSNRVILLISHPF